MILKRILKWVAWFVAAAAVILVAGWIAFVPSAKEAGYEFVTAWGGRGAGPGQFHDPTGIAVTVDEVFVSDARNSRIQVFDYDGKFKRQFGTKGNEPGQLGRPMNLAIANGELFITDYWN